MYDIIYFNCIKLLVTHQASVINVEIKRLYNMPKYIEKAEEVKLPVLPLKGTTAFPALPINLEITRDISMKAFHAAVQHESRVILVSQKDIAVENPTPKDLYKIGTVCAIKHVTKTPDGMYNVIFEGLCRAKITSFEFSDGFFTAEAVCKVMFSDMPITPKTGSIINDIIKLLNETKKIHPLITDELLGNAIAIKQPSVFADFVAANFLLNLENKQKILDIINHVTRLERLLFILTEERSIVECEFRIHQHVRKKIDEHQKEFYLREQMKFIQQELGEDADEIEEYAEKIEKANLPQNVKEKLNKELSKLSKTPFGAAESTVLRNYLDTCLEIPWNKASNQEINIATAKNILEKEHEGLKKIKERMLEYVAVKSLSPDVKNQIICLVGPPGIGKTSIIASLARAMKRKYARISLGGIRDEADIRGHRKTYVGAMPGRIVNAITEAESMNPIIALDEIDKLCRDNHGDPSSALLEALDPEQNKYFRDHFLEIPLDLSDCIFIATANNYEDIPTPLLDRMEVIHLPSYSRTEKFAIATKHLLPKQMKRHGLKKSTFKISPDAIYELIDYYTREAGVRNLEREIAALCRKAAVKIVENTASTVRISASDMESYLGKRKYLPELISEHDEIGIVNGLAYTSVGGDLLKVEVVTMNGSGKIELTGSLGDVMKESAKIAISYIRSVSDVLNIDSALFEKKDIHIHFPEGAVPKDGPSAGVTMTCALVSALTNIPVRRDVAMTGEITLTGKVLPIGGLKEKTLAAYCAGVKNVLIPRENEKDLDEIDVEARENLNFILCDTAQDIFKNALVSIPAPKGKREDIQCKEATLTIPLPLTNSHATM